jgi:hypothetical protein
MGLLFSTMFKPTILDGGGQGVCRRRASVVKRRAPQSLSVRTRWAKGIKIVEGDSSEEGRKDSAYKELDCLEREGSS